MSVPWYAEDSILDTLESGRRIYDTCYRQDLTPVSDVAVFINNADVYALDVMTGHHLLASAQYNTWANELTKLGAPFDQYQLDDVALPGMDRYKVYFFLNAFNVSPKQKENIHRLLRSKPVRRQPHHATVPNPHPPGRRTFSLTLHRHRIEHSDHAPHSS